MNTVGFLISHKNNERRRALLPCDMNKIQYLKNLYFEEGYGHSLGISDDEYISLGATILPRKEILKCDILVDVKLGDADYLNEIELNKTLVGWAHAVQNIDFTSSIIKGKHTIVAWEEMFEDGRYIFYKNREVAGEAAVLQAFRYSGRLPYDSKVAIIGNGQTAKGAFRILASLGADIDIYGRKHEKQFKKNMFKYNVLVNCVMWDTNRKDRLIYKEDIAKMKNGTLIIDVSCDPYLEIETSHPTTIDNPIYEIDGVIHYAVDNTPAMYPISVTKNLSKVFSNYVDKLVTGQFNSCMKDATIIEGGKILDKNIIKFREERGIFCK